MVDVLLVLEIFLTEDLQVEDLLCGAPYCSELYNLKANGDPSVLNCPQTDTEDDHPILCKEVEAAVQSLKKRESAGVDNIPADSNRWRGRNYRSHDSLQQDLADRRKANPVDPVLCHQTS